MRRKHWAVVLLAGAAAAASTGCPDSDPFNPGNHQFNIEARAVNESGWACVLMDITALDIVPVDGDCVNTGEPCFNEVDCGGETCEGGLASDSINSHIQVVSGDLGRNLAGTNFSNQGEPCEELNVEGVTGVTPPLQYLSRGRYRINTLRVGRPTLVADDGTTIACDGYSEGLEELDVYQDDLIFRIGENESNTLRLVLDVEPLETALTVGDCVQNLDTNEDIAGILTIEH